MSVSKWAYSPELCDNEICPGDCDLCDLWNEREDTEDEDETETKDNG